MLVIFLYITSMKWTIKQIIMCKLYEHRPAGMKQMKRLVHSLLFFDCCQLGLSLLHKPCFFSIASILSLISDFILQNCGISIGIPRPASRRDYKSEPGNCHVCTLLPDRVHRFCTDSHRRVGPQHGPPDRAAMRLSVARLYHFLLWWVAI